MRWKRWSRSGIRESWKTCRRSTWGEKLLTGAARSASRYSKGRYRAESEHKPQPGLHLAIARCRADYAEGGQIRHIGSGITVRRGVGDALCLQGHLQVKPLAQPEGLEQESVQAVRRRPAQFVERRRIGRNRVHVRQRLERADIEIRVQDSALRVALVSQATLHRAADHFIRNPVWPAVGSCNAQWRTGFMDIVTADRPASDRCIG